MPTPLLLAIRPAGCDSATPELRTRAVLHTVRLGWERAGYILLVRHWCGLPVLVCCMWLWCRGRPGSGRGCGGAGGREGACAGAARMRSIVGQKGVAAELGL
jgi:hypothetical protein